MFNFAITSHDSGRWNRLKLRPSCKGPSHPVGAVQRILSGSMGADGRAG